MFRARSPSPLLWSGMSPVKPVWSPSPTVDAQGQILYGLKELSLGEGVIVSPVFTVFRFTPRLKYLGFV